VAELTIETLAQSELEARERIRELEADNRALAEVLRASIAELHAAHVRETRQRDRLGHMLAALRALRDRERRAA
jgi:hypothetical protein